MAKKKTNPHRQPVKAPSREEILTQVTVEMTHRAWAAFLGSVIDFSNMTTEKILNIWHDANNYSEQLANIPDMEATLRDVDDIIGMHMPYAVIQTPDIKTQGDLNQFRRKLEKKCLYSAFALMAKPMVVSGKYDEDFLKRLFHKAVSLEEDVANKTIKIWEITDALEEEFGLLLNSEDGNTHLRRKEQSASE